MPRIACLSVIAALFLAAIAPASHGQSRTLREAEMRAAFHGRTVSIKSASTGNWIMLSMRRDGRCALTWSARPYRTRCQIRGNLFCYRSARRRTLVCGTMAHLGGDDYLFRVK